MCRGYFIPTTKREEWKDFPASPKQDYARKTKNKQLLSAFRSPNSTKSGEPVFPDRPQEKSIPFQLELIERVD